MVEAGVFRRCDMAQKHIGLHHSTYLIWLHTCGNGSPVDEYELVQ